MKQIWEQRFSLTSNKKVFDQNVYFMVKVLIEAANDFLTAIALSAYLLMGLKNVYKNKKSRDRLKDSLLGHVPYQTGQALKRIFLCVTNGLKNK